MNKVKKKNITSLKSNSWKNQGGRIISKTMVVLTILLMSCSCSSTLSAKKLEPREFSKRTYRWCDPLEVADYNGKVCHRYCCEKKLLNKCSKECLIVEDPLDPNIHNKFRLSGSVIINKYRLNRIGH